MLAGAILAFVSSVALAACGSDDEPQQPDRNSPIALTIGASVPLSGELEQLGPEGEKAAKLAVDEIEKAIDEAGVEGSIDLVTVDNATDPNTAVSTAETLVERDGVDCIVGPWSAPDTLSVARSVAIPTGTALISPATTIGEMSGLEDDALVNRTALPDTAQGPALADAIAADLGGAEDATVNIAARDDAYGAGLANSFARAWEAAEGTIGERVSFGAEAVDSALARRVVAGDPDAVVIFDFADSFAKLAPLLAETEGYDPEATWAADFLASTEIAEELPQSAIEGIRGTTPGTPRDDPNAAAFEQLGGSGGGEDGGSQRTPPYGGQTFDAVILCYLAAVAAGSDSGAELAPLIGAVSAPPGTEYGWRELPEALEALERGREIDYQGASGPIDLDAEGDPTKGTYDIYRFDENALVIVDQVAVDRIGQDS